MRNREVVARERADSHHQKGRYHAGKQQDLEARLSFTPKGSDKEAQLARLHQKHGEQAAEHFGLEKFYQGQASGAMKQLQFQLQQSQTTLRQAKEKVSKLT